MGQGGFEPGGTPARSLLITSVGITYYWYAPWEDQAQGRRRGGSGDAVRPEI
jgi:hypothetical protein